MASKIRALQLSDRTKHVKNMLLVVLLLLVAAGISFAIEHSQIQGRHEATGHIVAKHIKPHGGGPYGDFDEIMIEYQVNGQRKDFATSRAVWDIWGTLNTIGSAVPVVYWDDGKASINGFSYLYPITTTLLCLALIGGGSILFVFFIPQTRYKTDSARAK